MTSYLTERGRRNIVEGAGLRRGRRLRPMPSPSELLTEIVPTIGTMRAIAERLATLRTRIATCKKTGFPACQRWEMVPVCRETFWLCAEHRECAAAAAELERGGAS